MRPREFQNVSREVFESDEMARIRESTLHQGLDFLRQQRRRRQYVNRVILLLPIFLLPLVLFMHRAPLQHRSLLATTHIGAHGNQTKMISDAELFALFPGRPLALIGSPGDQKLVFLDQQTQFEDQELVPSP